MGFVGVGDWGVLISEDGDVGETAVASEEGGRTLKEGWLLICGGLLAGTKDPGLPV